MGLKLEVEKIDDVDEAFRSLYTEKDGKHVLTGVDGMKTQADIDRLQGSLTKERDAHKETKTKFSPFAELDPEEVLPKLDRFDELEAAAEGKLDEDKINELADKRAQAKLGPVEREKKTLLTENATLKEENEGLKQNERRRIIHDAVRSAATSSKVVDTALDDVLMLAERTFEVGEDGNVTTRDNVGVTPGIEAAAWLTDMQPKRPHWWPSSQGGGAGGSGTGAGGKNPFTHENWNMTEQGKLVNENRDQAEQFAKAAGTTIGGQRPAARK